MGMLGDILIIVGIITVIIVLIFVFLSKEVRKDEHKTKFTYDELKTGALDMINNYISINVAGMGLTKQAVKNQEIQRRNVARSVRTCNSGNTGSRVVVKDLIYNWLCNIGIDDSNIDYAIPFDRPWDMTARQLLESMIYMRDKNGEKGFLYLHNEYNFIRPVDEPNGNMHYEVTEEDIREMSVLEPQVVDLVDKLNILTQMLFADALGLGVIDTLNYQKGCIEEIQVGLAGLQQQVYNYKNEIRSDVQTVKLLYSKDAVHILIHGVNIWLSFLGFETENEKQRVLRNLIQDSAAGELTYENPWASVEATDGRRLTVSRFPISDTWEGFIRKFDTLMVVSLDSLYYSKPGASDVNLVIQYLTRAGAGIGCTGEMSAGKTSLLRTILKETRSDQSIGVIESGSFELNVRRCLPTRNSMAVRVTENITEEEVLALIRRTTRQILCVGEINSHTMANLTMNVSKFSTQTFFSAHYVSTDDMVQDFVAAKIREGHFSNEKLAEMDAVKSLQFDIHLRMVRGCRYIQYINEVIPEFDDESGYDAEDICENNANIKVAEGIREVRKQLGKTRTYSVRKILAFNEDTGKYEFYNKPSERCYEKARLHMTSTQYQEFCDLFEMLMP